MPKAFLAPTMRGTLSSALISRAPETPRNLVRYALDQTRSIFLGFVGGQRFLAWQTNHESARAVRRQ